MDVMTQHRVLLLDAGMQKINIISLKRALVLLFSRKEQRDKQVNVLKFSDDGAVIGHETKMRIPSVLQLSYVIPHYRQRVRFCRKNVLVGRDRCICQYCGKQGTTNSLTLDHVIPRAQGGQTTWENIVASCMACNQKKANRTPAQAGMKLLKKPARPGYLIEVTVKMELDRVPDEWKDYWDVTLLP